MNDKYINFKYDERIEDVLSKTILNEKDIIWIEDMKNRTTNKIYNPIVSDLYKLIKIHRLTTTQIAQIYDTGLRNIQKWLKELGINRSIKKAKKIKKKQCNSGSLDFLIESNNIKYKDFRYEEELKNILSEITLTKEDIDFIETATKNHPEKKYSFIIEDLYKLVVIMKTSNKEVSSIYGLNIRTLCTWLNELNFHRVNTKEKKVLAPARKDDYIDFKYENKESNILKITSFTKEQEEILKKIYEVWGKSKYNPIIEDLYKFWLNNYTAEELGVIYNKSGRIFQIFFKKVGLGRDRFEAQAIAVEKRNYKEITLKGRETMLKNNTSLEGSPQEQYLRQLLNCKLPLEFPYYEIIVGLNNRSILDDGKEIDIPVIIMNDGDILKLAIEYNGTFWHKDKNKDEIKKEYINQKGYKVFYVQCKEHATDKQIREEIDRFCNEDIIGYIKKYFKRN